MNYLKPISLSPPLCWLTDSAVIAQRWTSQPFFMILMDHSLNLDFVAKFFIVKIGDYRHFLFPRDSFTKSLMGKGVFLDYVRSNASVPASTWILLWCSLPGSLVTISNSFLFEELSLHIASNARCKLKGLFRHKHLIFIIFQKMPDRLCTWLLPGPGSSQTCPPSSLNDQFSVNIFDH